MKRSYPRCALVLFATAVALLILSGSAWAVDKDKEDGPGEDPYTKMKPEALKALGYESYGPFSLTPSHTTQDVEDLIGAKWMLWVETPHYKIGSTLGKRLIVNIDQEDSKRLGKELARLKKRMPRHVRKIKELDEWMLLHLYAQRLEELYGDMAERFAVEDGWKPIEAGPEEGEDPERVPYTGWKNKFIVILFEQKANLARYVGRYVGLTQDSACRHWFADSQAMLFATSREACSSWPDEDTAFLCHLTANMVHVFLNSYGGYKYRVPLWWGEGLKHWYVRRIDHKFFNPTTAKGQKLDYRRDHEWNKKVLARIKQDYYRPAKDLIRFFDPKEMDFADHMMAWSRVDYLLTLGNDKTGKYMEMMNTLRWVMGSKPEDVLAVQEKALSEAWGIDPDTLDQKWTQWVLKEYKNYEKRRK